MNVSHDTFKLKKVINASGKLTALGVSTVNDNVTAAQNFGAKNFFVMDELILNSGKHIANILNAEDGHIVSSASAGISQVIAAVVSCGEIYNPNPMFHFYQKREIILPKGHNIDFGAPVELMVTLGGGYLKEAGYSNACTKKHIKENITESTAALMYVVSHHCVQKSMLSVEELIAIGKDTNLPTIIDAAAEEDFFKYIKMGADIVIYSGGKAINGPSASGIVLGKRTYIEWLRLQQKGIGRAMKVSKETIFGTIVALEEYLKNDSLDKKSQIKQLEPFIDNLNKIDGIKATIVKDEANREIYRARVLFENYSAAKASEKLKDGYPAIYTREYNKNNGLLDIDIRSLTEEDMLTIINCIRNIIK